MKPICLQGYQVVLRQIEQKDLEQIRQWRNDPAISQFMLSQDEISAEQQQAWYSNIERDDSQQHFVILYKNQAIGSANIKARYQGQSLSEAKVVEPGLYIANEGYRNNILAFAPTLLLNDYCFDQLGVNSLVAVVKAENQAALKYNFKLGYQLEITNEKQPELVKIILTKEAYSNASVTLKKLLSR